jgi:hypothetical protein
LIFDIPGSYRCHLAKCSGGYDDLEWWNWCHDEEVIKPNRENVMARRKVVKVEEVNETEVNETEVNEEEVEETQETAENIFVLSQKTKYDANDKKAYAFNVTDRWAFPLKQRGWSYKRCGKIPQRCKNNLRR